MKRIRRTLFVPALSAGACALLLTGCGGGRKGDSAPPPDTVKEQPVAPTEKPRPLTPSKVTKENYDKIKIGMTRKEVDAILGHGGKVQHDPLPPGENSEKVFWRDGRKLIQVLFKDGKVIATIPKDL